MQVLLLRLKAPLMSFGDVDGSEELGPTMRHPGKSMIAGLIANALGYTHHEPEKTQAIQDGIEIASLELVRGQVIEDQQASEIEISDMAWSTTGTPMLRSGHHYSYQCSLRRRKEYIAGADYVVAIRADEALLATIAEGLKTSHRPVYLGRRCCLPTRPLFFKLVEAESLTDALRQIGKGHARWPASLNEPYERELSVTDLRDWKTRLHGGRRLVAEGLI